MMIYDIQSLSKAYPGQDKPANDNICLQIQQGEIFGLLGDNGAGKSTLVKQMVNLLRPTSGTIRLWERPLTHNTLYVPLNVGYMPQDSAALNNLTFGEALYFTAHLRGLSRTAAQEERDRLLTLWQTESLRDQYSSRLSGGQRRLLRLAVAMAGQPPILILDEPTNDLDPQRRKLVWDVLREENQQRGTTIIFITHDAIEAEKVIQRVGIMREGKLVANGRPSELKQAVDQKLRLELFFTPGQEPDVPTHLPKHVVQTGHWLLLLDWDEGTAVLNQLDFNQIDDFRLNTATLEDLYLHYAQRP
jgi:ABC-type multidrug transport system ATPase subunit